ncbi:MAG: hypothetical protein WAM97_00970 [Acidimicrobiales bacterium]
MPGTINHACSTDDTVPLGMWLYSLPQGSPGKQTTVNFGSGCYLVSGTLLLRDFRYFVFEGGKFEQRTPVDGEFSPVGPDRPAYCGSDAYTSSRSVTLTLEKLVLMFLMEGGCYLTFKDMSFTGDNRAGGVYKSEQDTFLTFAGSQYALVDQVRMRNPFGDYVDAQSLHEVPGGLAYKYPATNVTVEDSTFRGSGRQAIGIILANHISVEHNRILSAWETVFDVESDVIGGYQTDIRIDDNTVVGEHYDYLLSAQTGAQVDRLQFDGNHMIDGAQMRIVVVDHLPGDDVEINDNSASAVSTASDGRQPAIRIQGITASGIEIENDTAPNDVAGFDSVPAGSLVCQDGAGTAKCPVSSPVTSPAVAVLP